MSYPLRGGGIVMSSVDEAGAEVPPLDLPRVVIVLLETSSRHVSFQDSIIQVVVTSFLRST